MTYYIFDGHGLRRGVVKAFSEEDVIDALPRMGLDPNSSHVDYEGFYTDLRPRQAAE